MRNSFTLIGILTLWLAGCAVWRGETEVALPEMPAQFVNQTQIVELASDPWWLALDDQHLNEIMDRMFDGNLTLEQAVGRLSQLKSVYGASKSNTFPRVSANGNYQVSDVLGDSQSDSSSGGGSSGGSNSGKSGLSGVTLEGYSVSLVASYEIDLWGKLHQGRKAAWADWMATEADLHAVAMSMAAQTANAYYRTIELSQQLELVNRTVKGYEDYHKIISSRYQRGVSPSVELYQAQISLARAKSQQARIKSGLASAQHALSLLLGEYPEETLSEKGSIPVDLPEVGSGVPSDLIRQRPDVVAAEMRMRAADARWAEAVTARYPSLTLTGTLGGSNEELSEAFNPDNMLWNVVTGISAPLFAGGALQANAERTEAAFKTQVASFRLTVLNACREVEDALVAIEQQEVYLEEIAKLAAAADNLSRVSSERYFQGISAYLPVVLAQSEAFNAQQSLISARRELVGAYITLSTALGGSWMKEKV
ncbi:efflux transporter outer membrane subunit [Calditrichota bacterium]